MGNRRTSDAVSRFRDILALVLREQVRTAYDIAVRLDLPISSTYRTVADMERLSCLARDESGYLLVGARPQQIALNALGFSVAVQRLAPLARRLRDLTGETSFIADCTNAGLTVGTVADGYNPDHLVMQPFQTYGFESDRRERAPAGVFEQTLIDASRDDDYGQVVTLTAIELATSTIRSRGASLLVGVATSGQPSRHPVNTGTTLRELKEFFVRSQE